MRMLGFIFTGLVALQSFSQSSAIKPTLPNNQPDPKTQAMKVKMTASEAKDKCKQQGKSGPDLVSCIKEAQEGK